MRLWYFGSDLFTDYKLNLFILMESFHLRQDEELSATARFITLIHTVHMASIFLMGALHQTKSDSSVADSGIAASQGGRCASFLHEVSDRRWACQLVTKFNAEIIMGEVDTI